MAEASIPALPPTPDDGFYREVLRGIGAPVTPNTMALIYAWRQTEGGKATYNPFNTTLKLPGSTSYNAVGVQNYATPGDGVTATVRTLKNGKYDAVLSLLRSNAAPTDVAKAILASPWGTGRLLLDVLAMYARGKVVVAPISTAPGRAAASAAEASISNAPRQLPASPPKRRRGVPRWVWWTAGGTAIAGLLLWVVLAEKRRKAISKP